MIIPKGSGRVFEGHVRSLLSTNAALERIILPILEAWRSMRSQTAELGKQLVCGAPERRVQAGSHNASDAEDWRAVRQVSKRKALNQFTRKLEGKTIADHAGIRRPVVSSGRWSGHSVQQRSSCNYCRQNARTTLEGLSCETHHAAEHVDRADNHAPGSAHLKGARVPSLSIFMTAAACHPATAAQ
ncbi:MAG: hypothetical protein JZU55_02865 [Afipia sp.]|uniref:hypothetical protein n=1 Tax=Sphingomonadales TaxID=204457 RepID=UPI0015964D69|nr:MULTISPECIES: hypothetical protein [Sphingomonadaceae]MBV5269050.1 hypothetical protein [Afipia sp.]